MANVYRKRNWYELEAFAYVTGEEYTEFDLNRSCSREGDYNLYIYIFKNLANVLGASLG